MALFPQLQAALTERPDIAQTTYEPFATDAEVPPESVTGGLSQAEENQRRQRIHFVRERDRRLVMEKKRQVLESRGYLACEVCGFDFEARYGEHGRGFIECHHKRPLHTNEETVVTNLDDLAVVCSNCHRMIHAHKTWLSMEEVKGLLRP